jgi:ribonucleoside-diphosphate reductase alpha chain
MVILNIDHPDIEEFIKCKVEEEKKAWALIEAGYDSSLDGPAYGSVFFQNANNSVRVSDEFMQAVQEDREWKTRFVKSREVCETFKAQICSDDCGVPTSAAIRGCSTQHTASWHTCAIPPGSMLQPCSISA